MRFGLEAAWCGEADFCCWRGFDPDDVCDVSVPKSEVVDEAACEETK